MRRALILAAALALLPSPAAADIDDLYAAQEFTAHISESTETFPDDVDAFETWADGELEWLLAHPPTPCFGETWGLWLLTVEGTRLSGLIADTLDVDALTIVSDSGLEWGALAIESLDGMAERCAA
jgi:hypothetical protein